MMLPLMLLLLVKVKVIVLAMMLDNDANGLHEQRDETYYQYYQSIDD
jgi:hypothetical protein